jgi:type IV fimbrial biogenesis protein FimT
MQGNRDQDGVTLVELIFTLAVLATLLSISLPALGNLVQSAQARSARGSLMGSLALARMNAVARNVQVAVCPSTNQNDCTGGIWWQQGWIVFVDTNSNGKRDADEPILEAVSAQSGTAIATTAGRVYSSFRGDGGSPGTNLTFTLCDRRGAIKATTLVINNGGRVRAGVPTAAQSASTCAALQ